MANNVATFLHTNSVSVVTIAFLYFQSELLSQ